MGKDKITLSRWRPIIHWKGESGCPTRLRGLLPRQVAGLATRRRGGGSAGGCGMAGLRTGYPLGGSIKGGRGRKAPLQRPGFSGKPRRRAASLPTPPRMPEATCKIPDDPVAAPLPCRPLRGCRPYRLQAGRRLLPTGGHCDAAGRPPRRPPPPSFGSAPTCATARSGIDTISWAELGSSLAMTGGTPFPFENLFWPGAEASTGLEFPSIRTRARRPARGRRGRCRPEYTCPTDR